ncbi:bifunctional glutamate N-acetyltransferase/amino-acid acetyltransferase ArgJ [Litorivicinus sp.]|nr:bifunctional glutamate N-acetyltransferase/amino-acid acetyltransferase ArgJ [Litorivicinus sp.]
MRSERGAIPIRGVRLGSVRAPVYERKDRDDLMICAFDSGTVGSALTTNNRFCAAPVKILKANRDHTAAVSHWLINAGNANAGTGELGMNACKATIQKLSREAQVPPETIWPFSTGVIGELLPFDLINLAIPRVLDDLSETSKAWERAAAAIMTTDTYSKLRHLKCDIGGVTVSLTGMAKGSGMIHPDMATMFGLIMTDVAISSDCLNSALKKAVGHSFNCITVDGDTSTNDVCAVAATGKAGNPMITDIKSPDGFLFQSALSALCDDLAEMLARDGEGATKFVRVIVRGAKTNEDAHVVANTIALSPLVKTALAASDPNWGRVLAAIGRAPVDDIEISHVQVWINGVQIVRDGSRFSEYTESQGQAAMAIADIDIEIEIGRSDGFCRVMTCDLTKEYVRINAEYRT